MSATVCGLFAALSVIVSAPDRGPDAVGVKVTEIEHEAPAASDALQPLVCAKSPLVAIPLIVSAAVPLLVRVTVCAALVVPIG